MMWSSREHVSLCTLCIQGPASTVSFVHLKSCGWCIDCRCIGQWTPPQLGDRYGASREHHIVVPTMEKPSDSMARLYILKGMAGGGGDNCCPWLTLPVVILVKAQLCSYLLIFLTEIAVDTTETIRED